MPQHYFDPERADDPHALPDVETFQAYRHECRGCGAEHGLAPDYYGNLYPAETTCPTCLKVAGFRCLDTEPAWYWWACFPGCLPDSDPSGPFATEAEALADAREGLED